MRECQLAGRQQNYHRALRAKHTLDFGMGGLVKDVIGWKHGYHCAYAGVRNRELTTIGV
jgi:hypothetical protein